MKLRYLGFVISSTIALTACNAVSNMSLPQNTVSGIRIQALTDIPSIVKTFSAYIIMPENFTNIIAEKKTLSELSKINIPSLKAGYNRILEIVFWDENNKMIDRIACIFDNKNDRPIKINGKTTPAADILKLLIQNPGELKNYIQFITPEMLDDIATQLFTQGIIPSLIDTDRLSKAIVHRVGQLKDEEKGNKPNSISPPNLSPFAIGKIKSNQIFDLLKKQDLAFNKNSAGKYKGELPVIDTGEISPEIISVSPSAAYPGDIVYIKGKNFTALNPIANGDKINLKIAGEQTTPLKIYNDGTLDIIEIKMPYVSNGGISLTIPGRGQVTGNLDIRNLMNEVTPLPPSSWNLSFLLQWSSPFKSPSCVARNSTGNFYYITDTLMNCIYKFDNKGNYLDKIGSVGSGSGQFSSPNGIAVDSSNRIYVVDTGNNRVQKLDTNGTWIPYGGQGTANGQFINPFGIYVDASGNSYVADTGNNRIQKFDSFSTPQYVNRWGKNAGDGTAGTGNGEFNKPRGVTYDPINSKFYVTDSDNNRVQQFDSNFAYLNQFGSTGTIPGQFVSPTALAVMSGGTMLIVVDSGNNRLQKFATASLTYNSQCGTLGTGDSQFSKPVGIAFDSVSTNMFITDANNSRVSKMTPSFATDRQIANSHHAIATDISDNIYVADIGDSRVQKFDSSGNFIRVWGLSGPGTTDDTQLNHPQGLAVDTSNSKVYVADTGNNRIQKYDTDGVYEGWFGKDGSQGSGVHAVGTAFTPASGAAPCEFTAPMGVAVDFSGNIFVADTGNNRIQKFNSSLIWQLSVGATGVTDGLFTNLEGITVDSSYIYVADTGNNRIQKFTNDSNATFVQKWGSAGSADGQFNYPQGINNYGGFIYVTDRDNSRIQKFDTNGNFIGKYGTSGNLPGFFNQPHGIVINSAGVFVTDNMRVQKFAL